MTAKNTYRVKNTLQVKRLRVAIDRAVNACNDAQRLLEETFPIGSRVLYFSEFPATVTGYGYPYNLASVRCRLDKTTDVAIELASRIGSEPSLDSSLLAVLAEDGDT